MRIFTLLGSAAYKGSTAVLHACMHLLMYPCMHACTCSCILACMMHVTAFQQKMRIQLHRMQSPVLLLLIGSYACLCRLPEPGGGPGAEHDRLRRLWQRWHGTSMQAKDDNAHIAPSASPAADQHFFFTALKQVKDTANYIGQKADEFKK